MGKKQKSGRRRREEDEERERRRERGDEMNRIALHLLRRGRGFQAFGLLPRSSGRLGACSRNALLLHNDNNNDRGSEFRTQASSSSSSSSNEEVSRELPLDTLEVMRGFEQAGLKREEADVLTRHVTKLILQTTGQFSDKFASVSYLDKLCGKLVSDMKTFKSEMLKTQELQLSNLQQEVATTKNELAKLRTEIRYEMDKMISSQRLDMNLEKGRLRDELQATTHSVQTIETQLHKDINNIRTNIEANKNEIIKYSIGTLVALSSVGLALLRVLA